MPTTPQICDLSAALKRMGNNIELLKDLVGFFREDSGGLINNLRHAVAQEDAEAIHHAAHSLRGLIANFSAEAATRVALRLEQLVYSGDMAGVPAELRQLEQELARLDPTLTTELAKLETIQQ
ncbi:MAG TPA: Hpt domain-containing protein [Planctomycetaceae bacterium]